LIPEHHIHSSVKLLHLKKSKDKHYQDGYSISSVGANIATNQVVWNVNLSIGETAYTVDLIVLPGLGLDVILGMKWMSGYGVTIDTTNRMI
jgi:hypothetical protein